ncbi:hypothetical protein ABVT39_020002 [Epinephelus coioides]
MAATDGERKHETGKLGFSLDVPFPSSREAVIALRSLSPDREPRKGGISKQLTVTGSTLSEVERRRSSDPQGVCELVSGSPVARHGDHGGVRSPCFPVKPDT